MTESRAVTVVLAVGVLLVGLVLLIGVGPLAGLAFVYLVVVGQMLERVGMFTRIDEVWEDTDKALVNSAAAVEAVEELRAWLVEFRATLEMEEAPTLSEDETAGQPGRAAELPTAPQRVVPPVPDDGPPTAEGTEVAARQVRALMEEGVEMVERTYVVDGVQRTFRLRAVKEDA